MTSGLLVVLECGILELINECFGTSVVIYIYIYIYIYLYREVLFVVTTLLLSLAM